MDPVKQLGQPDKLDAVPTAVVLPIVKHEGELARLLEKTMEVLPQHSFRVNDAGFHVGAKVGVALFPGDGAEAEKRVGSKVRELCGRFPIYAVRR